jgi:outer membrane protein OmpU
VSAAYTQNGAGIDENDIAFVGTEYAFGDVGAVGLQYFDNGDITSGDPAPGTKDLGDLGQQWTLYGNYKFNDIIVKGYIATNDAAIYDSAVCKDCNDTVYGIGADYDLGGATLSGSIAEGYSGDATADIGVRFSF